jgi:putative nucleotidyltransferase with HDIG domain
VDLRLKQLRACSPPAFEDDPVRILRGIRQGIEHNLHIQKETLHWMRQAVPHLAGVSAERKRDEIFRILDGEQPAAAVRALEMLGVLPFTLPELSDLKGVTQSPPHVLDVWNHTLDVLRNLEALLKALDIIHDPDQAGSLMMGLVALRLGRYREQLQAHLNTIYTPERTLRALLYLAALYHDVGKPQTRTEDGNGRIRFIEHERVGASLADARAQALPLSNEEADRIKTIVNHHLRPILLSNEEQPPSRRAVYRFFRDCGAAGVDICLVSMADVLATYGAALPQATWERHLDTVRVLLEGWWEYPEERIFPPQLLDGHDIIKELNLQPGALIGQLLEMVREAQAEGRVGDRDSALTLLHAWIAENPRL